MSQAEATNDVNVTVKHESVENIPSKLSAKHDNQNACSSPHQLPSRHAICCNPQTELDTSDKLGAILLSKLKLLDVNFTTYQQAMLTQTNDFSDSAIIQSIGTNFKSLPRCIQFFISEHYKKWSDESFGSRARADVNTADDTFVIEKEDKLHQTTFTSITYIGKHRHNQRILIVDFFVPPDRSRFIHSIVKSYQPGKTREFNGMQWTSQSYRTWPTAYNDVQNCVMRLCKMPVRVAPSKDSSEETLHSSHQNGTTQSEVIAATETEHTRGDGSRTSKRNSPYVNYNVRDAFNGLLGNGLFGNSTKRRRLSNMQQTSQDQLQIPGCETARSTTSAGHSLSNQDGVLTSIVPGTKCNPMLPSKPLIAYQNFMKVNTVSNQQSKSATPPVERSGNQPEAQISRFLTASTATTVGMDESADSPTSLPGSASDTVHDSCKNISNENSPSAQVHSINDLAKKRTTVRFIDVLKGIDVPAPISECNSHDDLHDLAIVHKIATERTRLLRVEFDSPDNYQILLSDQPQHFEARFIQSTHALHAAHAHDLAKQFVIKVFNSDRVKR